MSNAEPTGTRTPRATPLRLATNPTAGGIAIAPSHPPVITRLIAVPTNDGKYLPANPNPVGTITAMNHPAALVKISTKTRLRSVNIPARQRTDPAALTTSTHRGPNATRVHWLAQRPAIMARAKAAIIVDAPFCSYPRSVVRNVTSISKLKIQCPHREKLETSEATTWVGLTTLQLAPEENLALAEAWETKAPGAKIELQWSAGLKPSAHLKSLCV